MSLLERGISARENWSELQDCTRVIDYLCPALRVPKLFHSGGAGMKNDKRAVDSVRAPNLIRFFARSRWHLQFDRGRSVANPEWFHQSEMEIERVQIAHPVRHKFVVGACPKF